MNYKPLVIGLIIFSTLLLAACQKADNPPTTPDVEDIDYKVKTIIQNKDTTNLKYDNAGRLVTLTSRDFYAAYTYNSDNTVTGTSTYVPLNLNFHDTYFLNGNNYLDSLSSYYAGASDSSTQKYIYAGNRLAKRLGYSYSPSTGVSTLSYRFEYAYDTKGNVIEEKGYDETGKLVRTQTYTYTDKPLNYIFQPLFYAALSTDLIASSTTEYLSLQGNKKTSTRTSTYEFDGKGRVIKQTDVTVSNTGENGTSVRIFIY